jgi:hypothetical protein
MRAGGRKKRSLDKIFCPSTVITRHRPVRSGRAYSFGPRKVQSVASVK